MTLQEAFEAYLADVQARNLSSSSVRGYRSLFRTLERFTESRGVRSIGEVDAGLLRAWRESWAWAATTHQTNLCRLKAFFRFAAEQGWLEESPAAGLRPPKVDRPPTMPLSRSEVCAPVRRPPTSPASTPSCS